MFCFCKTSQAGGALNQALLHVKTDYVAFLDHDDVWTPQKSAVQSALFKTHPDVDVVFGNVQNIITHGVSPVVQTMGAARALGASLLRRSCFDRAGYFRADVKEHMILEWWSRALLAGIKTFEHSEIVLHRYIHGDNFGIRHKEKTRVSLLAQLREHHTRRKARDD